MIDTVIEYFIENNVSCKKVTDSDCDFIAIFGFGNLTREVISKQIKDNNLFCMFFEGFIRKNEYKKKHGEADK